jgi:RNA 3'-terminal phosphate cyclase-like protein
MNTKDSNMLTFKGCNYLKQRLILSTLSGKAIKLTDIRCNTSSPGIRQFEVNLLRLMDKLTNGTKIELNDDGTSLLYVPGLLEGGSIQHDTCPEKGIGYYLDILVSLGPFCKNALDVKLKGVTNSADSPSVDHIKNACLPILKRFLIVTEGLELKVLKRGMMPGGGGEISFKCPIRKNLKAIQCLKTGMVKRIRGVAYGCKVSPALANRAVEAAKGVMLNFLPDIYIHTDQNKGKNSGNSCGYGINLVAETGEEVFYAAEAISSPGTEENVSETIPTL